MVVLLELGNSSRRTSVRCYSRYHKMTTLKGWFCWICVYQCISNMDGTDWEKYDHSGKRYVAIPCHSFTTSCWVHSDVTTGVIFGIMQPVWGLVLNIQQRRSFLVVNSLDQWRGRLSHYPRDPRDAEFLLLPDASRGGTRSRLVLSYNGISYRL